MFPTSHKIKIIEELSPSNDLHVNAIYWPIVWSKGQLFTTYKPYYFLSALPSNLELIQGNFIHMGNSNSRKSLPIDKAFNLPSPLPSWLQGLISIYNAFFFFVINIYTYM